jgi:hypothetical protein
MTNGNTLAQQVIDTLKAIGIPGMMISGHATHERLCALLKAAEASRADALTDAIENLACPDTRHYSNPEAFEAGYEAARSAALDAILAASPVEQPAAAPQEGLTVRQIKEVWHRANGEELENTEFGEMVIEFAGALLAEQSVAPVEQPAGAPKTLDELCDDALERIPSDAKLIARLEASVQQPAPSPADERAAFDKWWKANSPSNFDYASALAGYLARAASANQPGADHA